MKKEQGCYMLYKEYYSHQITNTASCRKICTKIQLENENLPLLYWTVTKLKYKIFILFSFHVIVIHENSGRVKPVYFRADSSRVE